MLDNFGLGEFFLLALLALLFFGPERLPQMGAKLGQWIAKLTSYSRSFMTEWREEALAIHEAVAEVRGIRDELIAAQREISGSLQTARDDVADSIDLAKEAVTDAQSQITRNLQTQRQSAARDLAEMAREEATQQKRDQSESAAIDKTQQILDALHQKQEAPSPETVGEAGATEAPSTPSLSAEEDEWERNRRAIQEIMNRSKGLPRSSYHGPSATGVIRPTDSVQAPKPATSESEALAPKPAPQASGATEETKEPRETAFGRTQKILDSLNKRRSGEAPAEEVVASAPEAQPAAPAQETAPAAKTRETAFDRSQQILDNLKKRKTSAATPAEGAPERASVPAADQQALEQIQAQVASLHDEIAALRREMEAIRSAARSAADELAVEEAL